MPNPGYRPSPLTDQEIVEMRVLRAINPRRATLHCLAELFDTTPANVHLIVTGQTHKNAGGPITDVRDPTTEEEVLEIRQLRALGYSYASLSDEFGKSEVALRSICSGKSFPRVGGPLTGSSR